MAALAEMVAKLAVWLRNGCPLPSPPAPFADTMLPMASAAGMGTHVEVYRETLAELYGYFIPYPIQKLHKSNHDHIALVVALRAGEVEAAVEVSRKHVDILHRTMFMGADAGRRLAFCEANPSTVS